MKKNQRSLFLFVGLMISVASQIAAHFTKMPDFASGILTGIGIGIMLLALIRQKRKTAF